MFFRVRVGRLGKKSIPKTFVHTETTHGFLSTKGPHTGHSTKHTTQPPVVLFFNSIRPPREDWSHAQARTCNSEESAARGPLHKAMLATCIILANGQVAMRRSPLDGQLQPREFFESFGTRGVAAWQDAAATEVLVAAPPSTSAATRSISPTSPPPDNPAISPANSSDKQTMVALRLSPLDGQLRCTLDSARRRGGMQRNRGRSYPTYR